MSTKPTEGEIVLPRAKIDEEKLIELVRYQTPDGKKLTQQEIADKLGVTRVAVARRIKTLDPTLLTKKSVDEFISNRAKIYAEKEMAILDGLTPSKIKASSARQIIAMIRDLQTMQRIEKGESTENVAHIHKHIVRNIEQLRKGQSDDTQKLIELTIEDQLKEDEEDNY